MGQSLVKNYVHIIFSTKNRQPYIIQEYEDELFKYLGGVCKAHECAPIQIGGHLDHVNILCLLSKRMTIADLLEEVKTDSSKWMKKRADELRNFYWQDGYGAFSVNPSQVYTVTDYIKNQREHHKRKSFQNEYRAFLKKYNVDYDERYVWG
ncbi:REP element-mobilizing transposase RayT [Algoriphagus ratkowskyi]|uniref:IS200/IS605 family transposase n=1 Tax=Algoriphagus ratkowskyi TaxID=57028 RepID=A0A2W7QY16_9BACT|nr:IS200/IS605 family transposase [Algoriphagus ratkowskyi]PZX53423.1 REP element-mobilizing transposase RayT [Algoriphagus ratkowskyi]TXD76534.1 IS200/IS605 family transposase [Algoriphagus ratkowskyi]